MKPEIELAEDQSVRALLCVPQLVRQRARAAPDAIAVTAGAATITYRELDRRASQLARHLRKFGVGQDHLVAVHMERSAASVISALASFKAGGAYLPLDPSLPAERLAFMLADAKVTAVVTNSALANALPPGPWPVIVFDDLDFSGPGVGSEDADTLPQHLAYVIYTSGSTGKPKGVEITHGSLLKLVEWHVRAFQITPADRATLLASVGFDAAVWELWPYLASGARVAIPDESIRNHPEALRDWLVANKITVSFLPTALAEQMLQLSWPAGAALRVLLTGAEALHRRPAAGLPFLLINNYGPTECTVVATSGPVLPDPSATQPPSIGQAIDNTEIHILDDKMRPVRKGESGEIYIAGAGVARGYRNNPVLTAERFLRNPFQNGNGSHNRLYRTGDLARFLPNGEIEFLGRSDEQMKIRGFRVEPGEIVSALNSHPGVQKSAVSLQGGDSGGKRLVAYVLPAQGQQPTLADLRETLARRLPEYMVPSVFVKIDSMPLTANGKVDYASLPEPATADTLPQSEFIAPRTLVEKRLAAILSPLLRVERVSARDNFFLLGGHSLLGTQLLTKIREAFDVDLSLLSLFDHPTLEGMSLEI
ncbi:MAG: non-ribosomal peptide synthetase, partial [Candidatus Sulfotelmatobacter sp.]